MSLAVLLNPQLPQPALLDAIRHSETGHLSDDAARTAVSPKGAVGPYQFMQKFLRDFGYGMPKDIPVSDVQDLSKSRQLADKFITGFSDYHQFTTPLEKLVAYNAGPQFAAEWKAQGANIADLPAETQKYVQNAAAYLTNQNQQPNIEEPQMSDMTFNLPLIGPVPFDTNQAMVLQDMAAKGNPVAQAALNSAGQVIGPQAGGQGRRMTLEEDYQMGKRTGQFIYAENYERYARENTRRKATSGTPKPPAMSMPSETDGNLTIAGDVISPEEAARRRVEEAIRLAGRAVNYPPSRYMDPRLQQQRPVMAMPSETDATQNIDGSQVDESAILNQVGQGVTGAFQNIIGPNSHPVVANVQSQPPAFFNGDPADQGPIQQAMTGTGGANASTTGPALTYNSTPQSRSTGTGQVSQNRRDRSIMSMVPPPQQRIGLNEALIRIGGAGVRGSAQGGLEAIGAMTDTYGQIQDANRATGLASYQAQMEALAKGGKSDKQAAADQQQLGQIDQTLFDMDRALGLLQEGGVTGPFDAFVADIFDRAAGSPDRASRLLLQKLRVDDAMLRVAQTKGAISNKEMELFLAPAPSLADQESVWIEWITARQEALRNVRSRLATGTGVAEPASKAQVDQFSQQGQGNFSLSQDDQALVNKYL